MNNKENYYDWIFVEIENFNIYKVIFTLIAMSLSIFTANYPYRRKRSYLYYFLTLISWILVGYVISLKRDASKIGDIDLERMRWAIPSVLMIAFGFIFFSLYDKRYKKFYHYYVVGIVLLVIGKAGVIITELGLKEISQILCVFSTALVVIGSLVELLNLKSKNINLYRFGKVMMIIGWILFSFNLSYNPREKKAMRLKTV